jgi:hypothetical protein
VRRLEYGLGLRWRRGLGDVLLERETGRLASLDRSSATSMWSALLLLLLLLDVDTRHRARRVCLPLLRLRSRDLRALPSREAPRRRPRSSGLKDVMRRRVLRALLSRESAEEREAMDTERLLRLPLSSCFWRRGGGEREGERLVEIVETESADEERERERERLRPDVRPRSSSFFLRMSSAMPFLPSSSAGTWVVSLGLSWGLRSCCVREGRDL